MMCQKSKKNFVSIDRKTERLTSIMNDPLMQVEAGDTSSSSEFLNSEASKPSPSQADRVSHNVAATLMLNISPGCRYQLAMPSRLSLLSSGMVLPQVYSKALRWLEACGDGVPGC